MIRASVSELEEFRQYLADPDYQVEDFVAYCRRKVEPTRPMMAGRALHTWLENSEQGSSADTFTQDGITFRVMCDAEVEAPDIREMSISKDYDLLHVRGRIDGLDGATVIDYKGTSSFDAMRFMDGYQWRFYLDMTGARRFRWIVFLLYEKPDGVFEIKSLHVLDQVAYDGMARDCQRLAGEFYEFARHELPERFAP